MKNIDAIRRHPANQHAASLPRQAKQSPSGDPLPVFQLMQWGLESGEIETRSKYRASLEAAIAAACRNPDQMIPFRFLMNWESEDEQRDLSEFLAENDPATAAMLLIEELHSKLGATVEGYH